MESEMANESVYFLVQTSDYAWGKGGSLDTAIKAARSAGSRVSLKSRKVDYVVFEFNRNVKPESLFVDAMGSARWEVYTVEPDNHQQGLVNSWVWRGGKVEPLDA